MEVNGRQRIRSVVRKEFRHIFRDRVSCLLLFLMPVAILLLFGYALSFDVHHHNIKVCNPEHSVEAERFFARLDANPRLRIAGRLESLPEISRAFAGANTRAVGVVEHRHEVVPVAQLRAADRSVAGEERRVTSDE